MLQSWGQQDNDFMTEFIKCIKRGGKRKNLQDCADVWKWMKILTWIYFHWLQNSKPNYPREMVTGLKERKQLTQKYFTVQEKRKIALWNTVQKGRIWM